ncbi:transmembrane emp24 domain-containing protein 9-like [Mauremys mutica]|uniref:transmembrane emp24 domain-containing protein 9-like n=1 Tax=Mauremys mutica TaxID=74926 RepID=UPI001D1649F7|nr:transmembrane emp24 domain-containing protein 9-like [Mauremys mutica]
MAARGGLLGLVLLLLVGAVSRSFGLYFHLGETERRCFIEEIPDETMVIGYYRTQLYDKQREDYMPATPGLGMFLEVKDPDDKVILSRQYGSEGRFTFTSHTPGEHQICLHSNSTKFSLFAGGMLRVHLDIQVGEHANDYAEIAAKDKLSELQLRVWQLIEQVEQIQKEQNYQRWREERFRQTSESTNQRVLWWSIVQTLILVAIGIWQMRHLKSFFEAKKLVMTDVEDKNEWKNCIDVAGVRLPTGYFFGASAGTGDLSDNHDIISMKLFQLMVEHPPEKENIDWTKIEPSVSLLKSPKDNVDDPTGNFRSGPLTGWKVFLLLLCALLGIIVCAVVGAVVFQRWQERNKHFY